MNTESQVGHIPANEAKTLRRFRFKIKKCKKKMTMPFNFNRYYEKSVYLITFNQFSAIFRNVLNNCDDNSYKGLKRPNTKPLTFRTIV